MAFIDFLPLIGDVVSGLFGNKATSSANATNLQLNRENNEANRQNMERQNQMNIEQWNRENAYNHPAAQMGRFTAAGLNPNLIYGQTNTAPQLSGSLGSSTSQAGSVMPNDAMSKMFGKLGETLMRIPMYREEVRGKRLDNEAKEIANWNARQDKGIREALRTIATDPKSLEVLLTSSEFNLGSQYEIRRKLLDMQDMNYRNRQNAWNDMLRNETFEGELQALASKYEVEYGKAQEFMTNLELMTDSNAASYRREAAVRDISDFFKDDLTLKEFIQGCFKLILDYIPKFGKFR